MLGTCFNLIALPLEGANLMISRMLALSLVEHLPDMIRYKTITKMVRQDEDRARKGPELTNRDELMSLARAEESCVLKLEAAMRTPGVKPLPCRGSDKSDVMSPFRTDLISLQSQPTILAQG